MSDGTIRFITRGKDTETCVQIARPGRSAEHLNLCENHNIKEIHEVPGLLANTELCGKLCLKAERMFLTHTTPLAEKQWGAEVVRYSPIFLIKTQNLLASQRKTQFQGGRCTG